MKRQKDFITTGSGSSYLQHEPVFKHVFDNKEMNPSGHQQKRKSLKRSPPYRQSGSGSSYLRHEPVFKLSAPTTKGKPGCFLTSSQRISIDHEEALPLR